MFSPGGCTRPSTARCSRRSVRDEPRAPAGSVEPSRRPGRAVGVRHRRPRTVVRQFPRALGYRGGDRVSRAATTTAEPSRRCGARHGTSDFVNCRRPASTFYQRYGNFDLATVSDGFVLTLRPPAAAGCGGSGDGRAWRQLASPAGDVMGIVEVGARWVVPSARVVSGDRGRS